jgi:hypothetical protein
VSRVLLFTQLESELPNLVGRQSYPHEAASAYAFLKFAGVCDFDGWNNEPSSGDAWDKAFLSEWERLMEDLRRRGSIGLRNFHAKGQAEEADGRWWLVECENAAHGRAVIAVQGPAALHAHADPTGRILASGGAFAQVAS